jgi:hypothetical protein
MAVNVTDVPEQTAVDEAEMLTAGITLAEKVTVTPLLVAVVVETQEALLVNTQVTTSKELSDEEVKLGLLVPLPAPFTFHW